jgi:threonine synthase
VLQKAVFLLEGGFCPPPIADNGSQANDGSGATGCRLSLKGRDKMWQGLIHHYGGRLGKTWSIPPVTLHEGNTPLVPASRLAEAICPGARLFLKIEGANPTGSFKDRGMTTAVTDAVSQGATRVVCASTGNTAASAAAYAARAGITCCVLVPEGKVALGKLAGAVAFGARVITVQGSFDDALRMVQAADGLEGLAVVNSVNPIRLLGQQTAAWELCSQLGRSPDWLALPVGNAGNISGYWMGFKACGACPCGSRPQVLGVQAAGAAPLVHGRPVPHPETRATAIRIGNPARGDQALAAIRESNGFLTMATDDEIFRLYRMAGELEGVFCEPSSAAGLAGIAQKNAQEPGFFAGKTIAAVLTGNGLKDPDSALERQVDAISVPADIMALREALA